MIVVLLLTVGCAQWFTAKTTATYEIRPDGTKIISYTSGKEQQGLDLDLTEVDGKPRALKIHVDKATTQEAVIAATLQLQLQTLEILKGLAAQAAAMGAGS